METLLLVPVDDSVVFPNMTVTLTVDVGDEERVLLVPREDDEFAAWAPWPRWRSTCACPAAATPWPSPACTAASRAPRTPTPPASCAWRSPPTPTTSPWTARPATSSASTAPWSRRSSSCAATTAASRPSCARSPSRARWPTLAATRPTSTYEQKVELLETLDVTERLEKALDAPARAAGRDVRCGARSATTCSRAPRSSSASTSCASRWSRSARSWARTTPRWPRSTARRSRRPACPTPCASRPRRSSAGSSAWASSRARAR